jgi:hypothetical protein
MATIQMELFDFSVEIFTFAFSVYCSMHSNIRKCILFILSGDFLPPPRSGVSLASASQSAAQETEKPPDPKARGFPFTELSLLYNDDF